VCFKVKLIDEVELPFGAFKLKAMKEWIAQPYHLFTSR
jgi:hypothetical protein